MKPRLLLVAATMLSSAFATDITLTDGRTLKDATIVSESPRKVMIKHAAGLTSVDKQQLSADLRAQYPVNEAAAQAADEKAAAAREIAIATRKAEAERAAKIRAEREASTAATAAAAKESQKTDAVNLAIIRSKAHSALNKYFLEKYSWNPGADRTVEVTISDCQKTEGWADRWTVTGRVIIHNYLPSNTPVNTTGMNAREASQTEYRARKTLVEGRDFQADYSPNDSSPLNVTMR